ncbi:hypothetical protein ATANTOWER_012689 [Ataeniobius toweri]|uniref:Uncharacterized protein n=1 Tax=Ataeniobius toweri TaxID=208326 RepID=A0ABU7A5X8_9TELE|nr:hypothetical protein [Ataeniobius toweri]
MAATSAPKGDVHWVAGKLIPISSSLWTEGGVDPGQLHVAWCDHAKIYQEEILEHRPKLLLKSSEDATGETESE